MHTAGGYLDQKTRSPTSMGAALAINGAIIGALLLSVPDLDKKIPRIIKLISVPPENMPEPDTRPPEIKRAAQNPQTVAPIPVINPPQTDLTRFEPQFTETVLPPVSGGTGEGIAITPPHTPIFVGPKINPRYADKLQPAYPPGKQRLGEEGVVVVRVLIGTDGRVLKVELVEAADDSFLKATAEHAMKRWRFIPATRDGVAVEGWRTMTVRFELKV